MCGCSDLYDPDFKCVYLSNYLIPLNFKKFENAAVQLLTIFFDEATILEQYRNHNVSIELWCIYLLLWKRRRTTTRKSNGNEKKKNLRARETTRGGPTRRHYVVRK